MADQLGDALQEVAVGFGLDVERRRRNDGECSHVHVSLLATGLSNRWLAEDAQREAVSSRHWCPFAFRQIRRRIARHRRRRDAVALDAQPRAVRRAPSRAAAR